MSTNSKCKSRKRLLKRKQASISDSNVGENAKCTIASKVRKTSLAVGIGVGGAEKAGKKMSDADLDMVFEGDGDGHASTFDANPNIPVLCSIPMPNVVSILGNSKGESSLLSQKESYDSILPRPNPSLSTNNSTAAIASANESASASIQKKKGSKARKRSNRAQSGKGGKSGEGGKSAKEGESHDEARLQNAKVQLSVAQMGLAKNNKTIDSARARVARNQKTIDTALEKRRVNRAKLIEALEIILEECGGAVNDETAQYAAELARARKEVD